MLTRNEVTNRRVQLMLTCLCDAFHDEVGRATVEVLEHLDCEIDFPEDQTCCGQPAFNAGDWKASRTVVRHTMDVFTSGASIVIPSGSCAGMMLHGAPLEFEKEPELERVKSVGSRTWELADYIVNGLGITSWPGSFPQRVAFHRSCHSRGTRSGEAAMQLLESIDGLEVVPFGEQEQCCGFGGAFSVTFPHLSEDIGERKLELVREAEPDILVSADMGCLMHLGGMIRQKTQDLRTMHLAEVLATSLKNAALETL